MKYAELLKRSFLTLQSQNFFIIFSSFLCSCYSRSSALFHSDYSFWLLSSPYTISSLHLSFNTIIVSLCNVSINNQLLIIYPKRSFSKGSSFCMVYFTFYQSTLGIKNENAQTKSDIVQRLGYAVFIRGIGVRLPVSEIPFSFFHFCSF